MASSPTRPGRNSTERIVEDVAAAYDAALDCLAAEDLVAMQGHLDHVDALAARLSRRQPLEPVDPALSEKVQAQHERLCSLISAAMGQLEARMSQAAKGRKALRGYGGRGPAAGHHHVSDA